MFQVVATACLFLAGKVEEAPKALWPPKGKVREESGHLQVVDDDFIVGFTFDLRYHLVLGTIKRYTACNIPYFGYINLYIDYI